jgi:hypothetical protein
MDERCIFCGAEQERHYDGVQCPVGEGKFSATQRFTRPEKAAKRIAELQSLMAYRWAREVISSDSLGHIQSGMQWFEIRLPLGEPLRSLVKEDTDISIEYLELRGLLERHPRQPWVHVKEVAD